jgi:hypothetical protein
LLAPLGFAARVDAVAGRSLPADFTSRRCSFGKNLIAAGRRKATGVVISGSKGALFGGGHKFDPETIRVMGLAFEMAPAALRLIDRGDLANEVNRSTDHCACKAGERDPERLCDGVLQEFHAAPPNV